jgi:glycerol-3-phosphate acyltransferase PlsX
MIQAAAEISLEGGVACRVIGNPAHLEPLLERHDHEPARLALTDTAGVFGSHGVPAPQGSSAALQAAAELVRCGEADAAVTAGDTADCVRTWLSAFGLVPGVTRPALLGFFPRRPSVATHASVGLILDVGATLRCHPRDYTGFAVMGATYYEALTAHRPRVGLLNVGGEPHKGGEPLARTTAALADLKDTIDFVGNVEGTDLLNGAADVVLCDGFTGNVLLKTLEGIAETATHLLHDAFHRHWLWRIGILMLSGGLRALRQATDYAEYGGSPLLGFPSLLIKAHGRSRARALKQAIRAAVRAADQGYPARLAAALTAVGGLAAKTGLRPLSLS